METIPDEEVVEGSTMTLRCIAAGYPTPTYRWKKTDLLGVTSNVFDKVNGVLLSETNKVLIIKNIEKYRHAGTYTCHATVEDGGAQKMAKESSKVTIREKPKWVNGTLITSSTPNISTPHSWKCMARGDPEPEYNWYANTTIMNNVSGRHTIEGGILRIHSVSPEDDGMYQCVAKNKFGFAYQTVSLEVKVKPPEITRALFQENFVARNTGLILCVSDSLPSADHHWLFNGAKLETNKTGKYGLTPRQDLLVHQLSHNDTGTYTCVATNTYGRATKEKYIKVGDVSTQIDATVTSSKPKYSQIATKTTSSLTVTTAEPKSTASTSPEEECSDFNKVFIALFSISLIVNVALGITVVLLWKKIQRNQDKDFQIRGNKCKILMKTAEQPQEMILGHNYDDVVTESGIPNDVIYEESFPSFRHNNNERLSTGHEYEEPSNYEPLRRNLLEDQADEHNYQSLITSQEGN
ncbi:contactin-3-like isoform X1 [Paramuricea clavata]|uniref:Contactin-3-like isoform X1 n=1 Tax=Paramuricea clavata TaxID=317549 RepID=A0A6S7J9F9_PARCT|nr:contactin-3-like isoform X1 [Paramuricea clavata]